MPSVTLKFTPPEDDNIAALRVYEAADAIGPFTLIERTTSVGIAPDYIDEFTTTLAVSKTDWFAIAWENVGGDVSDLSVPIKGGTNTWVGEIVKRVMERDSSQNMNIVTQEAEAAIESVGVDPYSDVAGARYGQLVGLTYLVLARAIIATAVVTTSGGANVSSATLGLISFRNETSASAVTKAQADTKALIDMANNYLGISTSFVLQLEEITAELGISSYDHSRLIGWVGLE